MAALDTLDRRIVAALHVNGRATWRQIAHALDQPERTVTRRGNDLLESGTVRIRALADPFVVSGSEPFVVHASCAPGAVWSVAAALARRSEAVVTHILGGSADCHVDLWCPQSRVTTLMLRELGSIPGIERVILSPVLRYVRTLHDWIPPFLAPDAVAKIRPAHEQHHSGSATPSRLDDLDRVIMSDLEEDGRASNESVARRCGVSEATISRRLTTLQGSGALSIRAIVNPSDLGLPIGALLKVKVDQADVSTFEQQLRASPWIRYAALVMGESQFIAELRVPDRTMLLELLTRSDFLTRSSAVDSSLVIETLKQGGLLSPELE